MPYDITQGSRTNSKHIFKRTFQGTTKVDLIKGDPWPFNSQKNGPKPS